MRENPNYHIREYNPILYDITETMTNEDLWRDRNRLRREIEKDIEKIDIKERSITVLEHELEIRGQLEFDYR